MARAGDLLLVYSDRRLLHGEILEVVNEEIGHSYRTRWPDGRENRFHAELSTHRHVVIPRPNRWKHAGRSDPRRHVLFQLPQHGIGAEVGVWRGDFALQMLRISKAQQLYLIDPWRYMPDAEHMQTRYGGSIARSQSDMDGVHAAVLSRFRSEIAANSVVVKRTTLPELAASQSPPRFDWVYLDGDHHYESVKADIEAAWRMVRPGGFIAGDDYTDGNWWGDSVIRATTEFVKSGRAIFTYLYKTQYVLERV